MALKRSGRTLKGLCPFHTEKTPSFTVDETKDFYYCFGCGAGGDVFKFVMEKEALGFPETVRMLADRAGMRIPELRASDPASELRERVLAANHSAQEMFASALQGPDGRAAREYLAGRGIDEDVVRSFGLGWAPDEWEFLSSGLKERFDQRELTAAGLAVGRPNGSGVYDRFRGRASASTLRRPAGSK